MSKKIEDCYQIHKVGKVVKVVHFQHKLLLLLGKKLHNNFDDFAAKTYMFNDLKKEA